LYRKKVDKNMVNALRESATKNLVQNQESFAVVTSGPWESVRAGTSRRGSTWGNYYHKQTRLYFCILQGDARVDIVDVEWAAGKTKRLGPGEGVFVEPGQAHSIRFAQDSTYVLLKSRPDRDVESDTFRFAVGGARPVARNAERRDSGLTYFPL
jgi:mannose-6-phosphate isomerase-like protein (cupin superfamily)